MRSPAKTDGADRGMRFRIKEMRLARGLTQDDMSEALDISKGLYSGLESGKRRMNETYLEGCARIFGVPVSDLIIENRPTISIAGKVGAGASVPVFDAYEKGDGPQVDAPPGIGRGIVAVEVEGDSMEPVYSAGDILFYTRHTAEGVPDDAIGRRCVCEDADGMGWVKVVKPSKAGPGLFDLHSIKAATEPMWGVKLKWAARVLLHWPAEMAVKR